MYAVGRDAHDAEPASGGSATSSRRRSTASAAFRAAACSATTSFVPSAIARTSTVLDFAFFNNRMDGSSAYYNKRSSDVILTVPISASATGAFVGVRERCVDQEPGHRGHAQPAPAQRAAARDWDIGVQFGSNRGLVKSLAGRSSSRTTTKASPARSDRRRSGYAPGVIRGADFVRCGRGLTLDGRYRRRRGVRRHGQQAAGAVPRGDGLPIAGSDGSRDRGSESEVHDVVQHVAQALEQAAVFGPARRS